MAKIDYKKELNLAQLKAVESISGAYLVIAGAGSGKTRVLVHRVAYLVEKGVDPGEILLLTFTRRAAEEMLRRASLLLDNRCSRVSGGTFHSFANSILRRYAKRLGLSANFTILDESDAQDTVNLIRTQLGFNKTEKRFPRKKAILEVISKSVNKSKKLEDVLYEEYPQFMEFSSDIRRIREEYQKYKCGKSLVDYDDLLVYLKNLLSSDEDILSLLAGKYKYIMVDEYQDTNKLQAHIACLLASVHKNIMVVGDDAQSIYSFRGADFRNIMDFPRIFKDAAVITLEENYRTTQPILNLTNKVISQAKEGFEKNLFTRKKGNKLPVFVDLRNENAQSRYIAEKILELREEGLELKDMAVLFRSGWHSNDLEVELSSRNIPFVKYGGQKFVEAAHIKDIISYLRIIHNFHDQVSWLRALLLIPGIGPKSAQRIIENLNSQKDKDSKLLKNEEVRELFGILAKFDKADLRPEEAIEKFVKYYQPLLKNKYDDYHRRLNDIESLLRIASRYASLEGFLTDMALEPPERGIVESGLKDRDDSSLTLSTIHSAKGLEWHTVFMIYVAEGHLPSYLSLEDEESLEEERRLFYVASTRAKENLFLLKPHIDRSARAFMDMGGSVFTQASRFIDAPDILDNLIRVENITNEYELAEENFKNYNRSGKSDEEFLRVMKEYFRDQEDY